MTTKKLATAVVLVGALAALATSVAWAATRGGTPAWMNGHAAGMGMMGTQPAGKADPVTSLAEAKRDAQAFADTLGLKAAEVLQFERNYYVKLVDAKGADATEVLVDPKTGYVSLEYGPAMMWNTKYGMAGGRYGTMLGSTGMMGSTGMLGGAGMMGRYDAMSGMSSGMMGGSTGMGGMMGSGTSATPQSPSATPLASAEARLLAQKWLDANDGGVKVEQGGDSFPGYFTFETLRDGKITGMISVNSTSGAVLQHWWHGAFVAAA